MRWDFSPIVFIYTVNRGILFPGRGMFRGPCQVPKEKSKMKLKELLATVEGSAPADWHKMDSPTLYGWSWGTNSGGSFVEPRTFETLLVYRGDVDISIAMAVTVTRPFDEPWVHRFPSSDAESVVVALRYRGAVVYEWVHVVVDGGRYLLPMPNPGKVRRTYEVAKDSLPIARLLFYLFGIGGVHADLDGALKQARILVV
jgi:hypothetical protein